MEDGTATDTKKLLNDLSEADWTQSRLVAARKLGEVIASNEEIIQTLATARICDKESSVRRVAGQALESPVHKAFLEAHPGLLQRIEEDAERKRSEELRRRELEIKSEFLHRRGRETMYGLAMSAGIMFSFCLFFFAMISLSAGDWIVPVFQVIVVLIVGVRFWLSWRYWRCPACDAWLGGWGYYVNPIWTPESLWCPSCGARLR